MLDGHLTCTLLVTRCGTFRHDSVFDAIGVLVLFSALIIAPIAIGLHRNRLHHSPQARVARGHCPSCDYDLVGLTKGGTCPECGHSTIIAEV